MPVVKNLSANAGDLEMRVQSLGQEDTLEEDMATHFSILENPMDRGAYWLQSIGSQRGTNGVPEHTCNAVLH